MLSEKERGVKMVKLSKGDAYFMDNPRYFELCDIAGISPHNDPKTLCDVLRGLSARHRQVIHSHAELANILPHLTVIAEEIRKIQKTIQ